ncbi:MAG: hypothetical protein HDR82_00120 [Bacteroides sp.]|nr:hypothetical protein [Bacteroides sp.]
MIKRTLTALVAAIALAGSVSAQNYLFNNPDNKSYLGIRAGVDISSTAGTVVDNYSNGAGFTIGAVYNIPLWQNLYFEPGVHFFYDTFGYNLLKSAEPFVEIDGSVRNFGFRIPFNFGYHFDFTDDISVSLFTGPVLNTNLTAKTHFGTVKEYNMSIMENGFKRFDMQWDFGVSMTYAHNYYVAITGAVGMTKAYNPSVDLTGFRRNTCNISIGYNF